jgi:hypothetical protein
MMQTLRCLAAAAAFTLVAPSAWAWWPPSPEDPHHGDRTHYQNDPTQPVQSRLVDCWLFDVQTWQQPLSHWTYAAAYHCGSIAQRHASGRELTPTQEALEPLLLSFEQEARRWAAKGLGRDHVERPIDSRDVLPDALALRSGWYSLRTLQDTTASDLGLLDVLEALQ